MLKQKPVSRKAQHAATCVEDQPTRSRREHFHGCAKTLLRSLIFSQSSARELDEDNVEHLLSSFQLSGCLRLDACYHDPTVVDHALLRQVLAQAGASVNDLRSDDPTRWPYQMVPRLNVFTDNNECNTEKTPPDRQVAKRSKSSTRSTPTSVEGTAR